MVCVYGVFSREFFLSNGTVLRCGLRCGVDTVILGKVFSTGESPSVRSYVGLARTIYIRCIYSVFGREITNYTVIYSAYIRFWPTLCMYGVCSQLWPTLFTYGVCIHASGQPYSHMVCVFTTLANLCIYGVCIYASGQPYSHMVCVFTTLANLCIYGVCIHASGQPCACPYTPYV